MSEFFRGKQWRDVTLEDLLQNYPADASACLGFMTESAFRYYLPAFLLIALNDRLEADVIPEITVSRLLLPEDGSREMDKFLERMGGFTLHEHRAIKAFLEHWQSELFKSGSSVYDARDAIKRYWGKF